MEYHEVIDPRSHIDHLHRNIRDSICDLCNQKFSKLIMAPHILYLDVISSCCWSGEEAKISSNVSIAPDLVTIWKKRATCGKCSKIFSFSFILFLLIKFLIYFVYTCAHLCESDRLRRKESLSLWEPHDAHIGPSKSIGGPVLVDWYLLCVWSFIHVKNLGFGEVKRHQIRWLLVHYRFIWNSNVKECFGRERISMLSGRYVSIWPALTFQCREIRTLEPPNTVCTCRSTTMDPRMSEFAFCRGHWPWASMFNFDLSFPMSSKNKWQLSYRLPYFSAFNTPFKLIFAFSFRN